MMTHSVLGFVATRILTGEKVSLRFVLLSVICPAIPDIDVLAFHFGIPYEHFFGHRGFFHSPFFALVVSLLVVALFFRGGRRWSGRRLFLLAWFFVLTASNGFLDAFTHGGLGVAFLSPLSNHRYLFSWTPIQAAPFGFAEQKIQAMADEFIWILFPTLLVWLVVWVCRNIFVKEGQNKIG
jgi:inner membrane protein